MKKASRQSAKETLRNRLSKFVDLVSTLASLAGVVAALASELVFNRTAEKWLPEVYWQVFAFVSVLVIATVFLTLRRDRVDETANFRSAVEHAFSSALDSSPLNPKHANEKIYPDARKPNL